MKPIKSVEEAIRSKLNVTAGATLHDRVLARVQQARGPSEEATPALNRLAIRRMIMKNPLMRFASAAAAVTLIGIVLYSITGSFQGASTAYGITNLPERIRNAKTMHMRGWFYLPQKGQKGTEPARLEFDYWFDCENGRYRLHKPGGIDSQTGEPKYYNTVSDGRYVISEAYHRDRSGKSWKSASYVRLSPFKARFEAYKNSHQMLMQMFGNIDRVGSSAKAGREQIEGKEFDVWQCQYDSGAGTASRIRTWLAPETGDIGRVLFWQKSDKGDPNWPLVFEIHTIALGVEPPPGIFNTDPPEGVKLDNTRETAPIETVGLNRDRPCGTYELHLHIGFTLSDGSVIAGWSCVDKTRGSQADSFEGLIVGGALPKLAGVIEGLTAMPVEPAITYVGFHLACTQKDGHFYEWALYVPDRPAPPRSELLAYNVRARYQVDEKEFGTRPVSLPEDLTIVSDNDFNMWVRGAMAELSDTGKAPEHVTYETVIKLAEKIRKSPPR